MLLSTSIFIFLSSLVAGLIGALLGLGGGIIIIPVLTLMLGIPIHEAIGASIVSVIATSSGSAIAYVRDKITNIRIGMFLETATTVGAITGAFIASHISVKALYITFALLMFYSAATMTRKRNARYIEGQVQEDPIAKRLSMSGQYFDKALHTEIHYQVAHVIPGWLVNYTAGILSGLLGIGGGAFKVLGMDVFMRLPMKVSTATSNFMIGVTAAASAGVYFTRGDIDPVVAGPVAIGVLIGALAGTRIMVRLNSKTLRLLFIPILLLIAIQMLWKAWWM